MISVRTLLQTFARFSALALLLPAGFAFAQTAATGQIAGTVTDPSKAAIAQALVTVTNSSTGAVRSAKTNADGDYTVPVLPPGNYSVSVAATGFKTQAIANIAVEVATTATVNIRLEIGEVTQQVTVEAAADILQTDSATNGGVVDDKTVPALPLSSRNYTQILDLQSGVSGSVPNAASLGKNSVDVFVNGGRIMDNSYQWTARTWATWKPRAPEAFSPSAASPYRARMRSRSSRYKPACTTHRTAAAQAPT